LVTRKETFRVQIENFISPRDKIEMSFKRRIANMLGMDPENVSSAEQRFIEKMNDCKLRSRVAKNLLKDQTKYLYKGSWFVCTDKDYERMRSVNSDMLTEDELIKKIQALHRARKSCVFTVAGCVVRSDVEMCHFLAFAWEKQDNKVVCFCPGWKVFSKDMIDIVLRCVRNALGSVTLEFIDSCKGPQDVNNCWYPTSNKLVPPLVERTDSFCQTWTLLWIRDYVNNGAHDWRCWGSDSNKLTSTIRHFVLWIQQVFQILDTDDANVLAEYY
jgi:hypothetical protein